MSPDKLLRWRDEFPILEKTTYLASHSLGAMPRAVYDHMREYADTWAVHGVRSWEGEEGWFALNGRIGDKIGAIMGAPAGTVTVHQNASLALSIFLNSIDFSDTERNKVVITDMIFPSDYYAITQLLPPHIEVEMVKSQDGIEVPVDELLDAIDERTRLVIVCHVLFRSSAIMPAQAIVEKAHQVGAQVFIDGYHAVGVVPVDVSALNVDYYIGGVLKWMCGGPGGVFMYVRPDLLPTLKPRITGWFAHERPFDFEVGEIVWRNDAYRMLNGTFGVASLYAIQAGVDIVTEVGVDNIREKSKRLTALLIELAQKADYTVRTPLDPESRGGMVVVDPPHAYEVSNELLARNFQIDFRPKAGIRIAPHFYNTDDEVRMVMEAIAAILDSGAWQAAD